MTNPTCSQSWNENENAYRYCSQLTYSYFTTQTRQHRLYCTRFKVAELGVATDDIRQWFSHWLQHFFHDMDDAISGQIVPWRNTFAICSHNLQNILKTWKIWEKKNPWNSSIQREYECLPQCLPCRKSLFWWWRIWSWQLWSSARPPVWRSSEYHLSRDPKLGQRRHSRSLCWSAARF